MIVELPPADWIVRPSDILEVEEMLKRAGLDFVRPDQVIARKTPTVKFKTGIFIVFDVLAAAMAAIAAAMMAKAILDMITTTETEAKRRRRRTQVCLYECLGIIEAAEADLLGGYASNRALETAKVKKTTRKFKSRA